MVSISDLPLAGQERLARLAPAALQRLIAPHVWRTPDGCWEWSGYRYPTGYGRVYVPASIAGPKAYFDEYAHRVAYVAFGGVLLDATELDHVYRNRRCVNPFHLEPVSHRENVLRGAAPTAQHAFATHCPSGHPYEGDNLYVRAGGTGRECRACRAAATRRYEARLRAVRASEVLS